MSSSQMSWNQLVSMLQKEVYPGHQAYPNCYPLTEKWVEDFINTIKHTHTLHYSINKNMK